MGQSATSILLYSDAPSTGGAEAYLTAVARAAADSGYRVEVATARSPATERWAGELTEAGLRVHRLPRIETLRRPGAFARHLGFFARHRYALTHFNQVDPWSCASAILAAHATGHRRLISTSHLPNTIYDVPTPWRARIAPRYLRRIIVIAQCHVDALVRAGRDVTRHRVVTNGIALPDLPTDEDRQRGRHSLGIDEDRVVIGAVGRLTPQKNHAWLIRAIARVPNVSLVIAGDGPERATLDRLVDALGVSDRVTLLGDRPDVARLLPGFDVFAMPSRYEGLPFAALEALAAGLPIVASDVPELREVAGKSNAVVFVPVDEEEGLATALAALAGDPADRLARGTAGRQRAEHAFDVRRMLDETIAIYREMLG